MCAGGCWGLRGPDESQGWMAWVIVELLHRIANTLQFDALKQLGLLQEIHAEGQLSRSNRHCFPSAAARSRIVGTGGVGL